jgi:hypothetical protein
MLSWWPRSTTCATSGFFLSFLPLGLYTCCVAVSALPRGAALPRWIGWIGPPIGIVQFVGAAGASAGLQNVTILLWLVWFAVLGVTMIARCRAAISPQPALQPVAARRFVPHRGDTRGSPSAAPTR